MRKLLFAFATLLSLQTLVLADPLPSYSFWQNQRGSTLEIFWVNPAGPFDGVFINQAAGFECQGIPYPAVGTAAPAAVIFTVSFTKCRSQTVWRGQVSGTTMSTKWVLTYVKPNGGIGILRGTDVFTRLR
ncbi:MAG TPA: avidin/streptavidin family protein [Xanthobacteraceae bacterium]|jgi:hypothetical protein|nr:avidin/streptavidin family protein [Xanthobacteraceae bacterium]